MTDLVQEPQFRTLTNGLRVVMMPQPHLHALGIGVYVGVGSRYETAETNGVSHFLEHVMFRGNRLYPSSQAINEAIESWGGNFNAYTAREETQYYATLHPRFLNEGLEFFSAFISEPTLAGVDLEREIILEERLEDVNEDGQDLVLHDLVQHAFWGRHPLGLKILGTPDTLKKLKESDLRTHFDRYYGARNLVLCLTGAFDVDTALPLIEQHFNTLRPGEAAAPVPVPDESVPEQRTSFVSEDDTQVEMVLSFLAPAPSHEEFPALQLASYLLGTGMSSRLYRRVIDELGLCYDVWAEMDVAHDVSFLEIGAAVAPNKLPRVLKEIAQEVAKLRDTPIEPRELEEWRQRWRFQQEFLLDKIPSLNELLGIWVLHHRYRSFEERWESMARWTPEELQAIWQKWLTPERMVLGAVGALSKKRKRQLKESIQTILGEEP